MSFRTRLALVAAAAVGIAVVVASVVVYIVVHNELLGEVDRSLNARYEQIVGGPPLGIRDGYLEIAGAAPGQLSDFAQAVPVAGRPYVQRGMLVSIPPTRRDRQTASRAATRQEARVYLTNRRVDDAEYRVLTFPAIGSDGSGYAVDIFRPLSEVNRTLHRISIFLILIAAGGMGVAAALGLLVARTALTPVRRLTATTEAITETRDLSQRIESTGTSNDELERLATSFNTMLGALEESSRAQRQLVADASHELRTPLTSLRTNIEVFARADQMAPEERERLLDDVVEQIGEMTALIGELIELARESRPDMVAEPAGDVRLDLLTADAVERTRRNRPSVEFETDLEESLVHGPPSAIERAVANLLDNAAKWSPPGGPVEVLVRAGEVVVRDHGPGIAEEDLPYVFDRFYRSRDARGMPGSGLGLAIVKQVAESHGGSVVAEQPPDGGTVMRLRLNGASS